MFKEAQVSNSKAKRHAPVFADRERLLSRAEPVNEVKGVSNLRRMPFHAALGVYIP